jgi:hypothetical protein
VPGQIQSLARQIVLQLTDEQKKELAGLQKRVDDKLDQVLTAGQKALLETIKHGSGRTAGGAGERSAPAPGQPPGVPRSGVASPGDAAGPLPPGVNPLFSALRYGPDYPGLSGRNLSPAE